MTTQIIRFLFMTLISSMAIAHEGGNHGEHQAESTPPPPVSRDVLDVVNDQYLSQVQPIFKTKCFDCHSNQTTFPWYYRIPGVKQLIDHDIAEAREHLDMSHDFPFSGYRNPARALEDIEDVVNRGEMPPFLYTLMHRDAKLSDADILVIKAWIQESLTLLRSSNH